MSKNSTQMDLPQLLKEMEDRLKQSYAAGWRDAMTAVRKAADQDAPEGMSTLSEAPEHPPPMRGGSRGAEPVEGSTPWYVLTFVRKNRGLTPLEIVGGLRGDGHNFTEAHVRTSLQRLKIKRHLAVRNGRWFPN